MQPEYFERVRSSAARRWDQLEADPDLAGPWHQLFKQVQSPRHVVSELLQNADDACATQASVRIEDGHFLFEHDGEDFKEAHFSSLCRFGYSNKRALHTIGFRGIGFKSTFSLGPAVELFTPSLSVAFDRQRFTEPVWSGTGLRVDGTTRIRVKIADRRREGEVEKNLQEWMKSPVSLLFFRHIRRVQVGDESLHWDSLGTGPAPESEWMALNGNAEAPFLVMRSVAEAFPDEALAEIREERTLSSADDTEFPPCKVEIVLGAEGRLFVVLPTGVTTDLPFACNAPFIQDPARLKIKDPETSPTNRWLLERAGRLANEAMHAWLERADLPVEERARAYGLMPDVNRDDGSLDGVCATTVEMAFSVGLGSRPCLLTESAHLVMEKQCILLPREIEGVWPGGQAAPLFDQQGRPGLSPCVPDQARARLSHWNMVDEVGKAGVFGALMTKHLPRPKRWRQLLKLWSYIAPEITKYHSDFPARKLRVVPVQGREVLYDADEVARLGEKKLLQSEKDWAFLASHLLVLNPNWTRFLAEQRLAAEREEDSVTQERISNAYAVLKRLELHEVSDINEVVDRAAAGFFGGKNLQLAQCVRLAQIAAKLGASARGAFRYCTRNTWLRPLTTGILVDPRGEIADLLPEALRESRVLHDQYSTEFSACKKEEWNDWIASGRSGLLQFLPLVQTTTRVIGRENIKREVQARGFKTEIYFPYVTSHFVLNDWDFEQSAWKHWTKLGESDDRIWEHVLRRILAQRDTFWRGAMRASAAQVATTGTTRTIASQGMAPSWAVRLRQVSCLPDTRGFLHRPGDLLRRTAETEAYLDVEPFVHLSLDNEAVRPVLDLLGVRATPAGPDRILDRLRALATVENPPVGEVEKWYQRLDQLIDICPTADAAMIRTAFRAERLILTDSGAWSDSPGVFLLAAGDEVPGAAVVRAAVRELSLWRKVGVAELPTADLAIDWLRGLPSGKPLAPDALRRVRMFLPRYASRVWDECGHWLNLAGEWVPVAGLRYSLTLQTLVAFRHLHEGVKQKTADFQALSAESSSAYPFSGVPPLADHIEERVNEDRLPFGKPEQRPWMKAMGTALRRVKLDDDASTARVRDLADRLLATRWRVAPGLETLPYIDGTPAGVARRADAIWQGLELFVEKLSLAKLAKRVPEEIGRAFGRADIKAALDYGFERSPEEVEAYLEENFTLVPEADIPEPSKVKPPQKEVPEPTQQPQVDEPGTDETLPDDLRTPESERPAEDQVKPDDERPRTKPGTRDHRPPKLDIMERYALANGFKKDGAGRYFHASGAWIGKTEQAPFPWEHRSRTGELVRHFWPAEHCLDAGPLVLGAELWALIDSAPGEYALILVGGDGNPLEMEGVRLREMVTAGRLKLYPAAYRLKLEGGEHA